MTPPAEDEEVFLKEGNPLDKYSKNEIRKFLCWIFSTFNLIDFYITLVHWQIVAVAFLAVALAAPQGDTKPIEIVSSNSEMNADGSYSFE